MAYALKGIKGFKVINSRYFLKENGGLKEPVFELTVVNNTQYVVSRAYFECELGLTNGPDGSLFVFEFDYEIPGGLEPGKIEKRQLPQSSLNEVPDVLKDKNSTNLRVISARIDGLDGEPIYDIKEYPKHNPEYYKERLDYITSRFEDLLVSMQQIEDEMREASKN